jgi:hypothetical protein
MSVALLDLLSMVLKGKFFTLALLAAHADCLMLRVQEKRRRVAAVEENSERLENKRRKAGKMTKWRRFKGRSSIR